METIPCKECGVPVSPPDTKYGKEMVRRQRAYCSPECRGRWVSRNSSERMARTNRKYASNRMKTNNPMHRDDNKERMKTTLRAMGWKPQVRGGNGTGPTVAQQLLACRLGWDMEVAVRTGQKRASGYPGCYKLDIANMVLKIGIEVDGVSHGLIARREQDQKKQELLATLGWTVLRFSNREVTERLEECVQTVLSTTSKLRGATTTSPEAS